MNEYFFYFENHTKGCIVALLWVDYQTFHQLREYYQTELGQVFSEFFSNAADEIYTHILTKCSYRGIFACSEEVGADYVQILSSNEFESEHEHGRLEFIEQRMSNQMLLNESLASRPL